MDNGSLVAVTGANGFIGRGLCQELNSRGIPLRPVSRADVGYIGRATEWMRVLDGVDTVIHTAAQAQFMRGNADLHETNVDGTRRLAEQAAKAKVRRLVFLSSVKVLGEISPPGRAWSEADLPAPIDDYAVSKWAAEQRLAEIFENTGLEVVTVRPPMVYGAGVRGNFPQLVKVVAKGIPLPLANVDNRRSMVSLANLMDLLILCLTHPAAAGQTLLVSDGEDLSTPELIRRIAAVLGRPARLLPCPVGLLRLVGRLSGKQAVIDRLTGSLAVDITRTRDLLGWTPVTGVDEGLRQAVCGMSG